MTLQATLRDLQHLTPQQWLERVAQVLPRVLVAVLVIAIAWQLVQLTWMLLTPPEAPVSAASSVTPTATQPARQLDLQGIVNAHLFGSAQTQPTQDPTDAPETQMNLVLTAVFAADDPQKGLAIIGDSAASAKVFKVGTAIRSGTKLHAVYADRVILDRGGQLETLALPRLSTSSALISRAPPPPAQNPQFADNLRRIAENNPSAFAEIVRPQPVFANGVQRGYRVYPGRNRQQFARLGLQPGDLILAINGTSLDDPQRGAEIFSTLGSSSQVTVTVERNGESQELTLNTAQITLPDAAPAQANPAPPPEPEPAPEPSEPVE